MVLFKADKLENKKRICYFIELLFVIYLIVTFIIFYREMIIGNGTIRSDLQVHLRNAKAGVTGYSLMYLILKLLLFLGHFHYTIPFFLTACILLTTIATYFLIKEIAPNKSKQTYINLAIGSNFLCSIFLPAINNGRYNGICSPQIYHNAPFLLMKLFAVVTLVLFFKLLLKYSDEMISFREWILFGASLFLSTWAKPSFTMSLAPVMLVFMIVKFVQKRGKDILRFIVFGSAVLPSVGLMLWQQSVLFDPDNKIIFDFLGVMKLADRHPIIAIIQGLMFPLFILAFNYRDLVKDKIFAFSWAFVLVNVGIILCLAESGHRYTHGNMGWGYSLALVIILIVSLTKFFEGESKDIKGNTYYMGGYMLLGMHFLCWFNYFSLILHLGKTFGF